MPVVDLHAHAMPRGLVAALQHAHPQLAPSLHEDDAGLQLRYPSGRSVGPFPRGMFDLDARLDDMDRWGVDVQALSIVPSNLFYTAEAAEVAAATALQNDALIALARSASSRFSVLAGLPLQDATAAVAEIGRCGALPEVTGVHIGTNVAGTDLDDPALRPVWAALEDAGLLVMVHPCTPLGGARLRAHHMAKLVAFPAETTIAAASLIFGGVATRHPGLRFCLTHGGGFLPYQIGRLDHGWAELSSLREGLTEPPSAVAARFYYDSITHSRSALRFLIDQVGAEQVFLGSDYAFDMGPHDPASFVVDSVSDRAAAAQVLETGARLIDGSR